MTHGTITLTLNDIQALAKYGKTPPDNCMDHYDDIVIILSEGAQDWFEQNGIEDIEARR